MNTKWGEHADVATTDTLLKSLWIKNSFLVTENPLKKLCFHATFQASDKVWQLKRILTLCHSCTSDRIHQSLVLW